MILDSHNTLKRRIALGILSLMTIGGTISTIIHRLNPHHETIYLIVPPLFAITSLILLICLYTKPQTLQQVIYLGLFEAVILVVFPSWFVTIKAFTSKTILVETLPPSTSGLFLLTTCMLITLRPHQLLRAIILTWLAVASPILTYLILNSVELRSPRGLDLLISLGPVMGVQSIVILLHTRLQSMIEYLYGERLQYYAQIIERQSIRQKAMEQAFTQIHNGPLQTLALLQRDIQQKQIASEELLQRLHDLNTEIRAVGRSLTDENDTANKPLSAPTVPELVTSEDTLRLGEGTSIDLNLPLHNLLHEVYSLTLKRNLPYFQTIKVKVRNFAPINQPNLTLEMKRDLCLWLEEALCNVGKHAQGVTRIIATGEQQQDKYILRVQDNGSGLKPGQQQGTKHSYLLAKRLGGEFRRECLPKGGVLCELSWFV
ncbi:MAG: hypothetical protein ACHBN1_02790 [Heteroscytonema crispum UTEX LB 1556]